MNIKAITILVILIASVVFVPKVALSQSMMGTQSAVSSDGHTAREEAEGKAIWEKLQAKETSCDKLSEDDFERLGEYFMGKMAGSSHEVMNNMMVRMMGEEAEKQMHIAMGKRNSGCDTSFIPIMGSGFGNMMGGWGGFGIFSWITMLVFWLLLTLGVVALIRYLGNSRKNSDKDKSPLDILKKRYARGEIDKKEFEEMKKDFS